MGLASSSGSAAGSIDNDFASLLLKHRLGLMLILLRG
jgi:hypothetical protein